MRFHEAASRDDASCAASRGRTTKYRTANAAAIAISKTSTPALNAASVGTVCENPRDTPAAAALETTPACASNELINPISTAGPVCVSAMPATTATHAAAEYSARKLQTGC